MPQRKTLSLARIGAVTLLLSGPAFAQVGGGNDLPSSATTSGGNGNTANMPQNNGIAAPGTGPAGTSATTGGSPMGTGGATSTGTGVSGRGQ